MSLLVPAAARPFESLVGGRAFRACLVGLVAALGLAAPSTAFAGGTAAAAAPMAPRVAPAPHVAAAAEAPSPAAPAPKIVSLRGAANAALGPESAEHVLPVLRQKPAEAHALLAAQGPLVARAVRTVPVRSFDELKNEVARQAKRVDVPVPGLYESIPARSIGNGGWKNVEPIFDKRGRAQWTERTYRGPRTRSGEVLDTTEQYRVDADGTRHLRTESATDERLNTTFETSYNPKAGVIKYSSTFLGEVEPWVQNKVALREDSPQGGVPTSMVAGLSQLRILGVPFGKDAAHGGPREVVISRIFNFETIVQLHWLKQQYPNEPVEKLLETTDSVTFTDSQLRQAGYRVTRVTEAANNKENPTGKNVSSITFAMKWFEESRERDVAALRGPEAGREARQKLEAFHDALLAKYGFNRRTWMYYDFDIHLAIEPDPAVAAPKTSFRWESWTAPVAPTFTFPALAVARAA